MYEILDLISRFGPVIVLVGTFFEGEIFAIIGGFLALRGSYPFQMMIALAFVGSFIGDLAVFLFARFFSNHRWVDRWRSRKKFDRALTLVERYQALFVILNRYIYGVRIPGLIALGLSRISLTRFLLLNFVGAALWAGIFTTIGYVFGYSLWSVFDRLEVMERGVGISLGVIAVALAAWFGWRQWGPVVLARYSTRVESRRRRRAERASQQPDDSTLAVVKSRSRARRDRKSGEG